jgi:hypothetical protein
MQAAQNIVAPPVLFISFLAAAGAYPMALILAVLGQGFGALIGGCDWIGISLPLNHQVWALVNQPVLNFSSTPIAAGYWLGSLGLPLVVAVATIPFLPRALSLTAELIVVQISFAAAAVALAWLPLIDLEDGHFVRWLALHGMPPILVWLAPVAAVGAALIPTLRTLELARRQHEQTGRGFRVLVIVLHLGAPLVAWVGIVTLICGALPFAPTLGAALVLVGALALAWFRYPSAYVRPLRQPTLAEFPILAITVVILMAIVWLGGRPLPGQKTAALLWGQPQAYNNLRPWIEPIHSPLSPR